MTNKVVNTETTPCGCTTLDYNNGAVGMSMCLACERRLGRELFNSLVTQGWEVESALTYINSVFSSKDGDLLSSALNQLYWPQDPRRQASRSNATL